MIRFALLYTFLQVFNRLQTNFNLQTVTKMFYYHHIWSTYKSANSINKKTKIFISADAKVEDATILIWCFISIKKSCRYNLKPVPCKFLEQYVKFTYLNFGF